MKAITINKEVKFLSSFKTFEFNGNIFSNLKDVSNETLYNWGFRDVTQPALTANKKYKEPLLPEDFDTQTDTFIFKIIDLPTLTPEEIKQQTKQRYEHHKANGWEAYQNFRANIISDISNAIITEAQAFAIEEILGVAYNKISASGDWKTAHYKLTQVVIPQGYEFVQQYFDAALQEIETYIAENYE